MKEVAVKSEEVQTAGDKGVEEQQSRRCEPAHRGREIQSGRGEGAGTRKKYVCDELPPSLL